MRIDFSELDNEEIEPSSKSTSFGALPQIWKNTFNKQKVIPVQVAEQDEQSLTFSVNYPYQVTRYLSPSAVNKELAYLQAKKILPTSTLRFIHNTLHAQLEKQTQKQLNKQDLDEKSPPKQQKTEKSPEKNVQNFDLTSKLRKISHDQNNINDKKGKKKYDKVKPRVYDIKQPSIRDEKYRKQENLEGVTLKPILIYTMNSKTAKNIEKKRNHHFKTYHTNVFQSLYYDAAIYSTKKQMKKMILQEQSRITFRSTSKVNIYSTFEQRLQTSIEKNAEIKKKAQNKIEYDLSSGQKYFVPNTMKSKITYYTHFKSLSPHRHIQTQQNSYRQTHASIENTKLNSSYQKPTTLNHSYQENMNSSLDGKYKIIRKPLPRQNKLAEFYANLLWNQDQLKQQALSHQQRQILQLFLQQIKLHYQNYSKNISKQVFIAFFKEVFASLNLFDRSILQKRFKQEKLNETTRKKEIQRVTLRKESDRQKLSGLKLNHTHKHFFI